MDFPYLLVYRFTGRESNVKFANQGLASVHIIEAESRRKKKNNFIPLLLSLFSFNEQMLKGQ